MAATKTLTAVDNLLLRLIPNWTQQVQDGDTTKTQFTQWALKMTGVATDNAGTKETGCEVTTFGSWQDTPYTPKQLYDFLVAANTMNTVVANATKTFYQNMINKDLNT